MAETWEQWSPRWRNVPVDQVRAGDYLEVGSYRRAGSPHEVRRHDERVARAERVEQLPPVAVDEWGDWPLQPVAMFCQGVPGVLVLFVTVGVMLEMRPDRVDHDLAHPTWPAFDGPFFVGGTVLDDVTDRSDWAALGAVAAREQRPLDWDSPRPAGRVAAFFAKPAHALVPGDYLRTITRHPAADRDTDEGFHRVTWVGRIDPEDTGKLFTSSLWTGRPVTVVVVHGATGVLLLPDTDEVAVLVAPNPERQAEDVPENGEAGPMFALPGVRDLTPAEADTARRLDEELRPEPPVDEMDLYPQTIFGLERDLLFRGRDGLRLVPVSQLPWPHLLGKCDHRARIGDVAATYPTRIRHRGTRRKDQRGEEAHQAAAAEAFACMTEKDFASCSRHEGNWELIGAVAQDLLRRGVTDSARARDLSKDDERLTEADRRWLHALFADPITWSDDVGSVGDGQHRTCALRAAGVTHCPAFGRHLPDAPQPVALTAQQHALRTVEEFWNRVAITRYGDNWAARFLGRALARQPALRRLVADQNITRY